MSATAKIISHQNGTYSITGLRAGDLRLISRSLIAGATEAGDGGHSVSASIWRLGVILGRAANRASGPIEFGCSRSDAEENYREVQR